jgi:hypothetical protein
VIGREAVVATSVTAIVEESGAVFLKQSQSAEHAGNEVC